MTEYVQVPVSLIERAQAAYEAHGWKSDPDVSQLAILLGHFGALLSQPNPTAEPVSPLCLFGHDALTAGGQCRRCGVQVVEEQSVTAEPPRIEDMAPGTTFWKDGDIWTVEAGGIVRDESDQVWPIRRIDPFTIRDVTPPENAA